MSDASLMEACAELRALLANPNTPEGVVSACLRLSEYQTKLFCTVPESYRAADRSSEPVEHPGAFDRDKWSLRLEPSNLLRELLAALLASEWPRVIVLVHDTTSDGASQ